MNEHQKNRKYGQYMDRATMAFIIFLLIVIGTTVTASIVEITKDDSSATPVPTETIAPETTIPPTTDETQQQ